MPFILLKKSSFYYFVKISFLLFTTLHCIVVHSFDFTIGIIIFLLVTKTLPFVLLVAGDNNFGDDRLLYAHGQLWLNRHHIMGRAVG